MIKIYVILICLLGIASGAQLTSTDFYSFVDNNDDIYNTTNLIRPSGFTDDIMILTIYNFTNQISVIWFQDMELITDDKNIVEKIKGLVAATKWG